MANDKINNSDLINLLSDNELFVSKNDSSQFLTALQSTFQDLLIQKRVLKISGIGTFKLVKVDARKSVDVRNGNEILIPEHDRVTFTPDATLKELVDSEPQEFPLDFPIQKLSDQAKELASILDEINGIDEPADSLDVETPKTPENQQTTTETLQENIGETQETESEVESKPEPVQESENQQVEENQQPVETPQKPSSAPEPSDEMREYWRKIVDNIGDENREKPEPTSCKSHRWIWLVAVFVCLSASVWASCHFAGDIIYTWCEPHIKSIQKSFEGSSTNLTNIFDKFAEKCGKTSETVFAKIKEISDDFFAEKPQSEPENDEFIETEVVESESEIAESQSEPNFDQMRIYTDIMAYETIKPGVHLAILSRKYWGHKDFWVYLYEANRNVIKNPNDVEIGTKIAVPHLDSRLVNPNDPQAVQYAIDLGKKMSK